MLVNHLMSLSFSSVYLSFILSEVDENNGGIIGETREDVGQNRTGETLVDE